jgi:NAD-dependent dihydropyrimidine dehydrogenase PreA subunit
MLFFKPAWTLPLAILVVGTSIAVFTLYDRLARFAATRRAIFFVATAGIAIGATAITGGGMPALIAAATFPALLTALLTFDYPGSTPLEGGSHFEEREWNITLDVDRCEGVFRCWEVCPEACFEKRQVERKVELAHDERCIRCGACVVQCPKDALFFEDSNGLRIEPETIRKFKLNLLGRRVARQPDPDSRPL